MLEHPIWRPILDRPGGFQPQTLSSHPRPTKVTTVDPDGRCGPTIVKGAYGTPKWKYMANWGDVTLLIGVL